MVQSFHLIIYNLKVLFRVHKYKALDVYSNVGQDNTKNRAIANFAINGMTDLSFNEESN